MNQYILLLLFLPLLLIPSAFGVAQITFEEFCSRGASDNRMTAADFICEVDIFQMKNDITEMKNSTLQIEYDMSDFERRLAYVETLTIPDYTKDPLIYDVFVNIDEESTIQITFTKQSFHFGSLGGFKIYDQNGILQKEITTGLDFGLRTFEMPPFDMSSWNMGTHSTGTLEVLSNNKVIHSEPFDLP